ncbi:otoferlin [Nephila pilipes]|uniref:Otoferlin n=1 Tax=Nephila pilipes TaxID=299642 RepID=A0A8X6UP40_NEPPI|nr:otoferlin [Nephila pilipes]
MIRLEKPNVDRRLRGVLEELGTGCNRFLTIVKGAGGSASTKTKLDKERTKLFQRELARPHRDDITHDETAGDKKHYQRKTPNCPRVLEENSRSDGRSPTRVARCIHLDDQWRKKSCLPEIDS